MHAFCPLWVFLRSGLAVPKAVARKPLPQKVSALDPSIRTQRPGRCDRYVTGLRSHLTFDRLRSLRKRTLVRDVSSSESNYENKLLTVPRKDQRALAAQGSRSKQMSAYNSVAYVFSSTVWKTQQ